MSCLHISILKIKLICKTGVKWAIRKLFIGREVAMKMYGTIVKWFNDLQTDNTVIL